MVTNGPDATAGSTFARSSTIGMTAPKKAAKTAGVKPGGGGKASLAGKAELLTKLAAEATDDEADVLDGLLSRVFQNG